MGRGEGDRQVGIRVECSGQTEQQELPGELEAPRRQVQLEEREVGTVGWNERGPRGQHVDGPGAFEAQGRKPWRVLRRGWHHAGKLD